MADDSVQMKVHSQDLKQAVMRVGQLVYQSAKWTDIARVAMLGILLEQRTAFLFPPKIKCNCTCESL